MECEDRYVHRIIRKYNRKHANAFVRANAERKFLKPFGLKIRSFPPAGFGDCTNLLSRQEEFQLFQALHFMKYKLKKARGAKQRYLSIYLALRNRGVSANWALIPNCIEKHTKRFNRADLPHLMEQGNLTLISAVDCFDPWRGYRFCTYACNAILISFIRRSKLEISTRTLDKKISNQIGVCADETSELWIERLKNILNTPCLNIREKEVLAYRFGCFGRTNRKLTLQEVADAWALTKERVRQIQTQTLLKLKKELNRDPVLH
ncbi:MAG: sigma-70 family RNA polymerase sigma factor [Promethearchaeota archaeon]|jgi:RNA polymerase sigma factor (sigma-70 family)